MELITVEVAKKRAKELLKKLSSRRHDEIMKKMRKYFSGGKTYDDIVNNPDPYFDSIIIFTAKGLHLLKEFGISQEEFRIFYQIQGLARSLSNPMIAL